MSEEDAEFDLPLEDILEIVASGGNGSEYVNWSQIMEDAAKKLREQAAEIDRLRAALREHACGCVGGCMDAKHNFGREMPMEKCEYGRARAALGEKA